MNRSHRIRAGLILATAGLLVAATVGWWNSVRAHRSTRENSRAMYAGNGTPASQPKPLSRADLTPVRVAVTPAPQQQIELAIDGPYRLRPVGSQQVLARGDKLSATTVAATSAGLRIGGVEHAVTRLEIVPSQSPSVWVNGHEYRGSLRLYRRAGGTVLAVNVLPLAEYLASVVDSEMPAAFPTEARKTQAIVARTYVLDTIRNEEGDPLYDVFASTSSQKYLGYQYRDGSRRLAGESEASRQIVRETTGIVCVFQGRLFRTYYSAVCGGCTTQGSAVFTDAVAALESVPCDYCRDANLFRWQTELGKSEASERIQELLRREGKSFGRLLSIRLVSGTPAGGREVPTFEVRDDLRAERISAATMRRQLPSGTLPSPFFTVSEKSDKLVFAGRGHGHAVGLCQWGARGQALSGKTAFEIVRYYYPGAKLVQLQ